LQCEIRRLTEALNCYSRRQTSAVDKWQAATKREAKRAAENTNSSANGK